MLKYTGEYDIINKKRNAINNSDFINRRQKSCYKPINAIFYEKTPQIQF